MVHDADEINEQLADGIYAAALIVIQCEEAFSENPDSLQRQNELNAAVEAYDAQCDRLLELLREQGV